MDKNCHIDNDKSIADFLVDLMSAGGHSEQVPDVCRTKWITERLQDLGCDCDYKIFKDTANVYATFGNKSAKKTICFCGHCDVVPARNWTKNPSGEIIGDKVYGRGAVDMLGGIASWFYALKAIKEIDGKNDGQILRNIKITTLLTGDEEGAGTHGTEEMVKYLLNKGEKVDICIVGEPTSDYRQFGDYSENIDDHKLDGLCYSRGGSFHFWIKVKGKSGHIAYVGEFDNPITKAVKLCEALKKIDFQEFGKMTNLEIVEFSAVNHTDNVILDDLKLHGNVRFFNDPDKKVVVPKDAKLVGNAMFDSRIGKELVQQKIQAVCDEILGNAYEARYQCDRVGYATSTENDFLQLAMRCMKKYNQNSKFVITRGCTDGEFMTRMSKTVCEIGLKCKMMHKIDEYTTIQDLNDLTSIYTNIIKEYALN